MDESGKEIPNSVKKQEFAPSNFVKCSLQPQNCRKIMKTSQRNFGPKANQPKSTLAGALELTTIWTPWSNGNRCYLEVRFWVYKPSSNYIFNRNSVESNRYLAK